jgi:hypothetical protein
MHMDSANGEGDYTGAVSQSLDLSRIPEPLRSKLQEQLERLPSGARAKLESQLANVPAEHLESVLAKAAPIFERLAQQGGSSAGSVKSAGKSTSGAKAVIGKSGSGIAPTHARRNDPNNHYNATIGRGDRPMPSLLLIAFVVALVLLLVRGFGAST